MRRSRCANTCNKRTCWSKQEDQKLKDNVHTHGEESWSSTPQVTAGLQRCGKSRKLRWCNCLREDNKRGDFGEDEEDLIIKLYALLGNRWSLIAGRLPGRTDAEVKHHWDSHLTGKLINMGIDTNNPKSLLGYGMLHNHHDLTATATPHDSQDEISDTGSNMEDEDDAPELRDDLPDVTSRERYSMELELELEGDKDKKPTTLRLFV